MRRRIAGGRAPLPHKESAPAARRLAAIPFLLVSSLFLAAGPVSADPPVEQEIALYGSFNDIEGGYVALANITRDDLCAWVEGGAVGEPPILEPVTVRDVETGAGAVVETLRAEWSFELWRFDSGTSGMDDCADTEGQSAPFAVGTGTIVSTDNDFFVSGGRMNSFGWSVHATVYDEDGNAHQFHRVFRAQITPSGELRVVVDVIGLT